MKQVRLQDNTLFLCTDETASVISHLTTNKSDVRLLSSVEQHSIPILIVGDNDFGFGIVFGRGRIDTYAVLFIVYFEGVGYVLYPYDYEWLEIFTFLANKLGRDKVLEILNFCMELAVKKNDVTESDLKILMNYLYEYEGFEHFNTLFFWSVWFYYACVAEEQYVRGNKRTLLGGLVKVVAYIEHVYEGYSLEDACNHYRGDMFYQKYGGEGSIVSAIKEKCAQYNVIRHL